MLSQEKFYKLSKYSSRLEKSYIKNNQTDYTKYLSHIKYHIGGDANNEKLNELFDSLIKVIKEKQGDDTYESLKEQNKNYEQDNEMLRKELEKSNSKIKELEKEKGELETKINNMETEKETNDEKIKLFEDEKKLLEEEKNKLEAKIAKYKQIIDNINEKLDLTKSGEDDEYITELNTALEQIKEKETNATAACAVNEKAIQEKEAEISELKEENEKLMNKISKLTKENEELTSQLAEKNNKINEIQDKVKGEIDNAVRKTKGEDIELFRVKLRELLTSVFGQIMADEIMTETKVAEEQESVNKEIKGMKGEEEASKKVEDEEKAKAEAEK